MLFLLRIFFFFWLNQYQISNCTSSTINNLPLELCIYKYLDTKEPTFNDNSNQRLLITFILVLQTSYWPAKSRSTVEQQAEQISQKDSIVHNVSNKLSKDDLESIQIMIDMHTIPHIAQVQRTQCNMSLTVNGVVIVIAEMHLTTSLYNVTRNESYEIITGRISVETSISVIVSFRIQIALMLKRLLGLRFSYVETGSMIRYYTN